MAMTEMEYQKELRSALARVDELRLTVSELLQAVKRAKIALRQTREYEALLAKRKAVVMAERQLHDARDTHDQIEREWLTGETGLPLHDAAKRPRTAKPDAAEAVLS